MEAEFREYKALEQEVHKELEVVSRPEHALEIIFQPTEIPPSNNTEVGRLDRAKCLRTRQGLRIFIFRQIVIISTKMTVLP